jgi:hypothetical protein
MSRRRAVVAWEAWKGLVYALWIGAYVVVNLQPYDLAFGRWRAILRRVLGSVVGT